MDIIQSYNSNNVYSGDCNGNFTHVQTVSPTSTLSGSSFSGASSATHKGGIELADVNGDGHDDLVVAAFDDIGHFFWAAGQSDGTISSTGNNIAGDKYDESDVITGDFTGNGNTDVVAGGTEKVSSSDVLRVYENDGSGNFTQVDSTSMTHAEPNLVVHDRHNDSDSDVAAVINSGTSGDFVTFANDGSGNMTLTEIVSSSSDLVDAAITAADIDDDGVKDIYVGGGMDRIYNYDPAMDSFNVQGNLFENNGYSSGHYAIPTVIFRDFTGNGNLDVLGGGILKATNNGNFSLMEGDGSFGFTEIQKPRTGSDFFKGMHVFVATAHDFDGDGTAEVAFGGENGTTAAGSSRETVSGVLQWVDPGSVSMSKPSSNTTYNYSIPIEGSSSASNEWAINVETAAGDTNWMYVSSGSFSNGLSLVKGTYDLDIYDQRGGGSFYSATSVTLDVPQALDKPAFDYAFEESSGNTAYDSSANGFDAGWEDAQTITPGVAGANNKAYDFGTASDNNSVQTPVGNIQTTASDSSTISVWYKPKSSVGNISTIFSDAPNGGFGTSPKGVMFAHDGAGLICGDQFFIRDGNGNVSCFGSISGGDGWTHLVVTYDGSDFTAYQDGKQYLGTASMPNGLLGDNDDFNFGKVNTSGTDRWVNGSLDEAKAYPYALSPSEVNTLYLEGAGNLALNSPSDGATVGTATVVSGSVNKYHDVGDTVTIHVNGTKQTRATVQSDSTWRTTVSGLSGSPTITAKAHTEDETSPVIKSLTQSVSVTVSEPASTLYDPSTWPSLVHYYPYDNNAVDAAGALDLSVEGGPSSPTGVANGSYAMDGTDDRTITNNASTLPSSAVSVSSWFSVPDTTEFKSVFSVADLASNNDGVSILYSNSLGKLIAVFNAGGTEKVIQGPSISKNTMYHAVITYDGSTVSFYVNDAFQGSKSVSGSVTYKGSDLMSGYDPESASYQSFNYIDETMIFNTALSSGDVSTLYNRGVGGGGSSASVAINDPNDNAAVGQSVTVAGTVASSPHDPGDSVGVRVDGTRVASAQVQADSTWSVGLSGLTTGNRTLESFVHKNDLASDRLAGDTITISVGTVTISAPVNGSTVRSPVNLSGSVSDVYETGDTVTLLANGSVKQAVSVQADSGYAGTLSGLSEQSYTLKARLHAGDSSTSVLTTGSVSVSVNKLDTYTLDVSHDTTARIPGGTVTMMVDETDFPNPTHATVTDSPTGSCIKDGDQFARSAPGLDVPSGLQKDVYKITPDNPAEGDVEVRVKYDGGSLTNQEINKLRVYRLNRGPCEWETTDVSHFKTFEASNMIEFTVPRFSTFRVLTVGGVVPADLSGFTVTPNPYKPNDGTANTGQPYDGSLGTGITFANVPNNTHVEIYTMLGGELVATSTSSIGGDITWNVRNESGQHVASGYYLYKVKDRDDNTVKTGKLAIIR